MSVIRIALVEVNQSEGLSIASFDMDAIGEYQRRETWGNAYRKPNTYVGLNSREVRKPFLRSDSRR